MTRKITRKTTPTSSSWAFWTLMGLMLAMFTLFMVAMSSKASAEEQAQAQAQEQEQAQAYVPTKSSAWILVLYIPDGNGGERQERGTVLMTMGDCYDAMMSMTEKMPGSMWGCERVRVRIVSAAE